MIRKCEYCHKRRQVHPDTLFCAECTRHFNMVVEKYLDGDPLTPLKAAEAVMKRPSAAVRISKYCVAKNCRRVGTTAKRVSDFWIVLCEQCKGEAVTLDTDKIIDEELLQ